MSLATSVIVAMAEIEVLKGGGGFSCLGLGSCIGLCVLDPANNVAGMAHVMLPESFPDRPSDKPGKFANTAVPDLLKKMESMGARREKLICAIAGGAQVFKFGAEGTNRLEIGRRNAEAVMKHLSSFGISVKAQEVGGSLGRTVIFDVATGLITVRTVTQGERKLCSLRG